MTSRLVRRPITKEMLAPLAQRHGDRWNLWPSARGTYACATLRRGFWWVRSQGRHPVGAGGSYVRTLVTESLEELTEAIERENDDIAHLLADGTLRTDR